MTKGRLARKTKNVYIYEPKNYFKIYKAIIEKKLEKRKKEIHKQNGGI